MSLELSSELTNIVKAFTETAEQSTKDITKRFGLSGIVNLDKGEKSNQLIMDDKITIALEREKNQSIMIPERTIV